MRLLETDSETVILRQDEVKIDFPAITWVKVSGGGRVGRMKKRVLKDGNTIRILELSRAWNEKEWCKKAHNGYVLSGALHLQFESSVKGLEIKKGQGFSIPEGYAHKASCKSLTRLFIVG